MSREQLDELLNTLIPFAQQQLERHGEFYPFGATMSHAGEVGFLAGYAEDEHPESQPLIDLLVDGLRSKRDQYVATGICFDSRTEDPRTGEKTDAIAIDLEGVGDNPVTVYLPYHRSRLRGTKYGEIFAAAGERRVFGDP
jgi:hypothetical protein